MKALIIGSGGQDGYFMRQLLAKKQVDTRCISRRNGDLIGDVGDYEFIKGQISDFQPDFIFHFAADSTTRHDALFSNHNSISTGTLNILESVRLFCPNSRIFLSGSALQFLNNGEPINERTPFDASSAYSVARIQSVYAARYFREKFGLKIFIGYFFNHDSHLRSERHVNQKIVQAVKRIASGRDEKIELNDILVKKEFSYAGDIVKGVWTLINQDYIFEAVIGSGKAYSIQEWVEYCFSKIGKSWQDYVIQKKNVLPEYKILVSDPKLINTLGWTNEIDFYSLADLMLSD